MRPAATGVFRYPLDLAPTLVVTASVLLGLVAVIASIDHVWLLAIVPLSVAGRVVAPAHQHAQGHLGIFRYRVLDALYEQILALAAGHTTAVWELQHSLGHHLQYLDARRDVAGSERFARGRSRLARRVVFMICADALTIPDAYAIAAQFPAKRRRLRIRLVVQVAAQLAALATLCAIDPIATLAVFIIPNVVLRWLVGWIAFAQHDGVPATATYDGSMNHFGFISRLLLNVGHHTAHHEKPTLHWSLLPTRTQKILHHIPVACITGTPDAGWGSRVQ